MDFWEQQSECIVRQSIAHILRIKCQSFCFIRKIVNPRNKRSFRHFVSTKSRQLCPLDFHNDSLASVDCCLVLCWTATALVWLAMNNPTVSNIGSNATITESACYGNSWQCCFTPASVQVHASIRCAGVHVRYNTNVFKWGFSFSCIVFPSQYHSDTFVCHSSSHTNTDINSHCTVYEILLVCPQTASKPIATKRIKVF